MPSTTAGRWAAFGAWTLVGAGAAFGVLGLATIGIFVLAGTAVLGTLVWRGYGRSGSAGLVSGLGLPLLYIAFLNRHGPGWYCTSTGDSVACDELWTPWPWLVTGSALVLAGLLLRLRRGASG